MHPVTKADRDACPIPAAGSKLTSLEEVTMLRSLALVSLVLSLTGCGVAETGTAAATAATAKAEEVRQGLQTEARVREQLDAASKQAADQRNAAEAASQ